MSRDHLEALERAAAPVLAAIEECERRAPRRLRPIFQAIRDLLFLPDLDREKISEAAGFADPEVWNDLREEVGETAWSYVRHARLVTAGYLLLQTSWSVEEIGQWLGYSSPSSFGRALRGFLGMSASQYRRHAPRVLERARPAPDGADTREYWERVLAGELSDAEAKALDAYLERLAPGSAPDAEISEEDERWRRSREMVAEGFVDTLRRLKPSYQRRLARDAVAFPDTTFFERLSRESREAGADDPEGGVVWAQLAVDSLAANRMLETHPQTASLGWSRLALARWRAGDVRGAIADVRQSMRDDDRARAAGTRYAAPEAERGRVMAAFYWFGGRLRDALRIAEGSVAAHRVDGLPELRKALILRAEVRAAVADLETDGASRRGELEAALADLEEARGPGDGPPGEDSPSQDSLATFSLWLRILVLIGDPIEKSAALPRIRRLAASLGAEAAPLFEWFEGHCCADGEPCWRRAREGFASLGDELSAARAHLDLARLYADRERAADASAEATKLVSALGTLVSRAEDMAALKALALSAAPMPAVTGDDLDAVERVLKRLEWDRRARRALDLAL